MEYKSIDIRVEELLEKMTLEEKVSQLVHHSKAIAQLGIKNYNWWNECLHGVARAGLATVFPQAIGMAASWNTELMFEIATAISDEARAKYHDFVKQGKHGIYQGLTYWSPNINIFRDPRWGRGMETYGEDPFLTSRIAVAFVKGLQGDDPEYLKVIATPKHFAVHSGPESSRHHFNAEPSVKDLWETYLPAFEACIKEAGAYSIMGAYNRLFNEACCASSLLLKDILRERWGFEGFVVSDCGAIYDIYANHKLAQSSAAAAALAVHAGTDLCCGNEYCDLVEAVYSGLISDKEIDIASTRLLKAKLKLGMFDADEKVKYASIPYEIVDCASNRTLAVKAARESIVLLKNENELLPLSKTISSIAVIGPNADNNEIVLGNYHGTPSQAVSLYEGLLHKVGNTIELFHEYGCELADGLPFFEVLSGEYIFLDETKLQQGLKVEYYNNKNLEGKPVYVEVITCLDGKIFEGLPIKVKDTGNFSIAISGILFPQKTGKFALGISGLTSFHFYIDDNLITEFETIWEPEKVYEFIDLHEGQGYTIRIEIKDLTSEAHVQKLIWSVPDEGRVERALQIASKAEVVILAMGLSPQLEGEEMPVKVNGFKQGDRLDINLPDVQEQFIRKIVAIGKPTILILFNGCALAINWAKDNIPAIIEAWYGGQAAGDAIADMLFGDFNPSGRLPITFYQSINQLPDFENYSMEGRTYRYFKGDTLFDFGFGLSYSKFRYSDLNVPKEIKDDEAIVIHVDIENVSERDGDEVVQLYISKVGGSENYPIKTLQGFQKVFIKSNKKKTVQFVLSSKSFSYVGNDSIRRVEVGIFQIAIGGFMPTEELISNAKVLVQTIERFPEKSALNN